MKTLGKKILWGLFFLFVVLIGFFGWYVMDDYNATSEALEALNSSETIQVKGEDPIHFYPKESESSEIGLIFYPGGKVETEAYAPLMQALAEEGYSVFLVDMPFGLAVFDIKAAEAIINEQSDISQWYLAGHSLGGAMAALFAENHLEELAGLILLAAYSTADLSQSKLPVLTILGSEDQVMNTTKVSEYRPMLPEDTTEQMIQGGNHAQFGDYGPQAGDGEASITALEQQQLTVEAIKAFIEVAESE